LESLVQKRTKSGVSHLNVLYFGDGKMTFAHFKVVKTRHRFSSTWFSIAQAHHGKQLWCKSKIVFEKM